MPEPKAIPPTFANPARQDLQNRQAQILLVTLNSTYQHCSFGLRYLLANLGPLEALAEICEFTIKQSPRAIVEALLIKKPKIIGFGIYIWNCNESLECISLLKKIAPEVKIVLGGPEVSYEASEQKIVELADYVIQGEGEHQFRELCESLLNQTTEPSEERTAKDEKIKTSRLPEIQSLRLPYYLYSDEDIRNRVIYVEASRGCPYKCEYCLSSLDKSVRSFDLELFLQEMALLIEKGARQFKFVDRTFNLSIPTSSRILAFFLSHIHKGLFLHFEMVPDRLPDELKNLITQFPAGSLQFEIGIQTWNVEVAKNVSRRNDLSKVAANFEFLNKAHVHSHADLIVGLPGETLTSFAQGFDALAKLAPDEIQVGILKRLRGAPISRHDREFKMIYQAEPPYQILANRDLDFLTMQKMTRFAKFWDLYANSGHFPNFIGELKKSESFFWSFFEFSEFLSPRHPDGYGISLLNQTESAFEYLRMRRQLPQDLAQEIILKDYSFGSKRRDIPAFLKGTTLAIHKTFVTAQPQRQQRHQRTPLEN